MGATALRERTTSPRPRTTGDELVVRYAPEAMLAYFRRKLPDVADTDRAIRIEEALKFLVMAHECTGSIPVTTDIDDIWHLWILQTAQYAELCRQLPSGEFLDHSSNDYLESFDPGVRERDQLDEDVRMVALYVRNFGPFQPDRVPYWRLAAHLVGRLGWSVDELNEWLEPAIAE